MLQREGERAAVTEPKYNSYSAFVLALWTPECVSIPNTNFDLLACQLVRSQLFTLLLSADSHVMTPSHKQTFGVQLFCVFEGENLSSRV